MTNAQIIDSCVVIIAVIATIIAAIYTKHKITIDKKAEKGNLLAKSEKLVAQSVTPLVYQAQKDGGEGDKKFNQVLNNLLTILDLANLPHPTKKYLSGEIEKGVAAMKQTQQVINSVEESDKNA